MGFPTLSDTYVRHLVAPQHIGDLDDAHGVGELGSMVGGLGVRVSLSYATQGVDAVIAAFRGRAFGSDTPVPALSWLGTKLVGTRVEDAPSVTTERVLAALTDDGAHPVPDRVVLATGMAVEALHRALGISTDGAPSDPGGRGILVCRCLGIGDRAIRAAIRAGALRPSTIGDATTACTGCRSCRIDLLALIDEETAVPPAPLDPARSPVEQIAHVCAGRALRRLGVELLGVTAGDGSLSIRIAPVPEGADTTTLGAVAVTRHTLRETVWDGIRVVLADDPGA